MLTLQNFSLCIEDKTIIQDLSYEFQAGKTSLVLGHNGSGKTSLSLAIAGHPRYEASGNIFFGKKNITKCTPDERSKLGIFLSFQNVPEIPGIGLFEYLQAIYDEYFKYNFPDKKPISPFVFRRMVEKLLPKLHLTTDFLARDMFVGFSGGEKRRIELLQIALLNPKCIILDEVDSGLDIDALEILKNQIIQWKKEGKTLIIVSHNLSFIRELDIDDVILMSKGKIKKSGDKSLLEEITKTGLYTP
ncbi:Fe-S cluster assembly ATPase SufC [Candidatus Gracilibacteria bacterium]|nr:MAG: Fe-S cluster assembly ATPase SufC [Candidatus Gracilibacteria bacterium]